MSEGANFDTAGVTGSVVKNVTDKSSCTIEATGADFAACKSALTGGTDNRWEPGDAYEIAGQATFKAEYGFTYLGATAAAVTDYLTAMTGKLGTGTGAPTCDGGTYALCSALSVRTKPTDDQPDGTSLGVLKVRAADRERRRGHDDHRRAPGDRRPQGRRHPDGLRRPG